MDRASTPPAARARSAAPPAPRRPRGPDSDALPPAIGLPPERRALQVVDGRDRIVDADDARARGLTLVDLSDGWAPRIFADGIAKDGAALPNHYRTIFVGLAGNKTDGDGQPLTSGEQNYLELYGIPPTLSVLRERFLADAARACDPTFDVSKLLAVDSIETWGATSEQKELAKFHAREQRLEAARVKANAPNLEALAESDRRYAKDVKLHLRAEAEHEAFAEIEKRLACEGLMDPAKHAAGHYDTVMRKAVVDFQQKHTLIDQADIKRSTLEALSRPLLENDFAALQRVLAERAAHAGEHRRGRIDPTDDDLSRQRRLPAPDSGSGRRRHDRAARAARHRHARGRGGILSPAHAGRHALAARRRALPAAARILRPAGQPHGALAPRSIAATSGTTSPSTPPACASRSRAIAFHLSRCS